MVKTKTSRWDSAKHLKTGEDIATLDPLGAIGWTPDDYKMNFGGTSAATPLAAGIAALMLSANPNLTAAEIRTLTILHTNDLHSRLMPMENKRGGFAYLGSVIRHERANCHDCILLNAGDLATSTLLTFDAKAFRDHFIQEFAKGF